MTSQCVINITMTQIKISLMHASPSRFALMHIDLLCPGPLLMMGRPAQLIPVGVIYCCYTLLPSSAFPLRIPSASRKVSLQNVPLVSLYPFPKNSISVYSNINSNDGNGSKNDEDIIQRTKVWVNNMVIGLHLCPFAEAVVNADTVDYVVSHARTPTEALTDVMTEALKLITT